MPAPPPLDAARHAVFLDFDGTLAPLQDDPARVFLTLPQSATLVRVATAMSGAFAIISGRDILDLGLRTPNDVMRIGGHGLDTCPPGALPRRADGIAPASLSAALAAIVARFPEVWLESKGRVLAVHYRANPDVLDELRGLLASAVADYPDYSLQAGKMVFEAKPGNANKGVALERAMQAPPFAGRTPVLVGDDRTDEDAMIAADALGGFGVKVGRGESVARWRLGDTTDVWNWLEAVS